MDFYFKALHHYNISTTCGFYAFATLDMMYAAMTKINKSASLEEKIWKTPEWKSTLRS